MLAIIMLGRKRDMIGLETTDRQLKALSDKALDSIEAQFSSNTHATVYNWPSEQIKGSSC
jgi:hypothetical protein